MSAEWLEGWRVTRQGGKRRFVWSFGVCRLGGMLSLFWCASLLIRGESHPAAYLVFVAASLVSGLLVGHVRWRHNETTYRSLTAHGEGEARPPG